MTCFPVPCPHNAAPGSVRRLSGHRVRAVRRTGRSPGFATALAPLRAISAASVERAPLTAGQMIRGDQVLTIGRVMRVRRAFGRMALHLRTHVGARCRVVANDTGGALQRGHAVAVCAGTVVVLRPAFPTAAVVG